MGGFFSSLHELFFGSQKLELCLVGLESSGKSTLLNILALGYPVETLPTIGLNVKVLTKEGVQMKVWDLGGQERFRCEWPRYTQGCDCIVYCVDASDTARAPLAGTELHRLLAEPSLSGLPLLVCLNKIDLSPHLSKEECIEVLKLESLTSNAWAVVPISALQRTNIGEVVDWLVTHAHE